MDAGVMSYISSDCQLANERILGVVVGLDEQQMGTRPNETTPSIEFHVWHLARWADYMQEIVNGDGSQIWERESLAVRWGFGEPDLGYAETGMGMDDQVLGSLPFPEEVILLDYARRAFAMADEAIGTVGDDHLHRMHQDRHGTELGRYSLGQAILEYLVHANRHLGMIECMIGVQGSHGTATH